MRPLPSLMRDVLGADVPGNVEHAAMSTLMVLDRLGLETGVDMHCHTGQQERVRAAALVAQQLHREGLVSV